MPIGNDIIDLDEASKHRPQYYERLKTSSFTEDEWLLNDLPPGNDGLWLLWSLKESAYKALVQGDWDGRRFAPRDFDVTSLKQNTNDFIAEISFQDRVVSAITTLQKEFLHTVTQPTNDFTVLFETFECLSAEYAQQSAIVRERSLHALAEAQQIALSSLEIRKNEDQVPQFFVHDQLMDTVDLSLSHHGRYGAYAMVISS